MERARSAGSYTFATDVYQRIVPKSETALPGTSGESLAFRVSGHVASERRARMRLAPLGPDAPHQPLPGPVEMVLFEHRIYARKTGAAWQRVKSTPLPFGGNGANYLALLHAAYDVQREGTEEFNGESYTRYRFQLDGQDYADYLQQEFARQALPNQQVLAQVPQAYRTMTGEGLLWVRQSDGLPYLQHLEVEFPDADEHFLLKVTLDAQFGDYGQPVEPPILPPEEGETAPVPWTWPDWPRLPDPGESSPPASPSSRAPMSLLFLWFLLGGLAGGLVLIKRRLRPSYEDSLRYSLTTFNWPLDSRGQIQDTGPGGIDEPDLMLSLMLEVTPDSGSLPPDVDELEHYQIFLSEGKIYVPLQTLSDGGNEVGFHAKLFYPADTPSWQSISGRRRALGGQLRLVWVVGQDDATGDRFILAQYDEPYVITGFVAEEQHGIDVAQIYDNTSKDTVGGQVG